MKPRDTFLEEKLRNWGTYKIICKVCYPNKTGNGYCAEHSTSRHPYEQLSKQKE